MMPYNKHLQHKSFLVVKFLHSHSQHTWRKYFDATQMRGSSKTQKVAIFIKQLDIASSRGTQAQCEGLRFCNTNDSKNVLGSAGRFESLIYTNLPTRTMSGHWDQHTFHNSHPMHWDNGWLHRTCPMTLYTEQNHCHSEKNLKKQ